MKRSEKQNKTKRACENPLIMGGADNCDIAELVKALCDTAYEDYKNSIEYVSRSQMSVAEICKLSEEIMTLIDFIETKREYMELVKKVMRWDAELRANIYLLADVVSFIIKDEFHIFEDYTLRQILGAWNKRIEIEREQEAIQEAKALQKKLKEKSKQNKKSLQAISVDCS